VFEELLRVPPQIGVNLETSGDEVDGGLVHAFESCFQVGNTHTWVRELLLKLVGGKTYSNAVVYGVLTKRVYLFIGKRLIIAKHIQNQFQSVQI
jgi:hypothetical protein